MRLLPKILQEWQDKPFFLKKGLGNILYNIRCLSYKVNGTTTILEKKTDLFIIYIDCTFFKIIQ